MENVTPPMVLRKTKAEVMLKDGVEPIEVKEDIYNVPSQSSGRTYTVITEGVDDWKDWNCSCPDHEYRHVLCKHIWAVHIWLGIKETMLEHKTLDEVDRCKHCNSTDIIKNGTRKNKLEVKTRYLCKDCNRTFVLETSDAFWHMKFDADTVTLCLDLYFKGFSFRKVQEHLQQFHGIDLYYSTVSRWIKKYVEIINEYVETLEPDVGHVWQADEMMIRAKDGQQIQEGGKWNWLWNVMDRDTRFLLANLVTKRRSIREARKVFRSAKEQAKARPRVMITDGLWSYKGAFNKEFYSIKGPRPRLERFAGPNKEIHNNKIERLNGTIREREKVMRGTKDTETAQVLADGFRHYYNFIRPHQALSGKTPAEMAGLDLELGDNKWLSLIKKSAGGNPLGL